MSFVSVPVSHLSFISMPSLSRQNVCCEKGTFSSLCCLQTSKQSQKGDFEGKWHFKSTSFWQIRWNMCFSWDVIPHTQVATLHKTQKWQVLKFHTKIGWIFIVIYYLKKKYHSLKHEHFRQHGWDDKLFFW